MAAPAAAAPSSGPDARFAANASTSPSFTVPRTPAATTAARSTPSLRASAAARGVALTPSPPCAPASAFDEAARRASTAASVGPTNASGAPTAILESTATTGTITPACSATRSTVAFDVSTMQMTSPTLTFAPRSTDHDTTRTSSSLTLTWATRRGRTVSDMLRRFDVDDCACRCGARGFQPSATSVARTTVPDGAREKRDGFAAPESPSTSTGTTDSIARTNHSTIHFTHPLRWQL